MKASSVLMQSGIECSISRTVTTTDGCIYTLTLYTDFEKAQSILQKYRIDYIIAEEGAVR
ncbi:MAG: hypothetical protein IJP18_09215 [Oscillospiraceae bacterium]|nr:hypothetical protein [Oscillospiraceae bacterium]